MDSAVPTSSALYFGSTASGKDLGRQRRLPRHDTTRAPPLGLTLLILCASTATEPMATECNADPATDIVRIPDYKYRSLKMVARQGQRPSYLSSVPSARYMIDEMVHDTNDKAAQSSNERGTELRGVKARPFAADLKRHPM